MSVISVLLAIALSQRAAPPAPQPFPQPGASQPARPSAPAPNPTTTPAAPAGAPTPSPPPAAAVDIPTEAIVGAPIYPGAQFLASYDAGRGQRFYLFGTSAAFLDIVTYYRTTLKQKGDLIFDAPATFEFDLGKFREETMAFPPGVTIKEFKSELSEGYPNPKPGGQPARFPTVIQFVAAPRGEQ